MAGAGKLDAAVKVLKATNCDKVAGRDGADKRRIKCNKSIVNLPGVCIQNRLLCLVTAFVQQIIKRNCVSRNRAPRYAVPLVDFSSPSPHPDPWKDFKVSRSVAVH